MKVNLDNYVELATATEAPVTEEMKERFVGSLSILESLLYDQITLSTKLDVLKKHLFYGAPRPEVEEHAVEYLQAANRIQDEQVIRLLHCAIGLATETGELMEALYEHIYGGQPLDTTNCGEELGDAGWYIGIGCSALRLPLIQMLQTNHDKLALRFPQRFTQFHAEEVNRNREAERKLLEDSNVTP
jgi:NTP pyrophosphatase (non-canonical NTP hydrolase)